MSTISALVAGLYAAVAATLDIQPDQVPSTRPPLTGASPPHVPAVPHTEPRPWNPSPGAGQQKDPPENTAGKDWTGWIGVQKLFVL